MAVTRQQKAEMMADLEKRFADAKSVFFSTYSGLTVNDISKMRDDVRETGSNMVVAKKNLLQIVAKQNKGIEIPDESIPGPIAAIFSNEDETAGARVIGKWSKDKEGIVNLTGGIFEGRVLTREEAVMIASIPGREQLLAKFLGSLKSPLGGFVRVLNEISKKGA